MCFTDLTRVVNLDSALNFDHVLPLAKSGTNDPANLQLLCEECNKTKGTSTNKGERLASVYW